ncbi:MAG: SDR family oxidoreductase, partial [Chloroflexota bacterium]
NQPEDIASAVVFLVSSASDNITGQDIKIDGGMLAIHPGWS